MKPRRAALRVMLAVVVRGVVALRGATLFVAALFVVVLTGVASPQTLAANISAPPDDCAVVDTEEVARILGYPVEPADVASRAAGICFFASRAISQEGDVSYALVTLDRLAQRRAFFAATARQCAGVAPGAPREFVCKAYVKLAAANDLDQYFAARTDDPGATALPNLGESAVATPGALYVRRGQTIFEVMVRRGELLDLERSRQLAKLLLERTRKR